MSKIIKKPKCKLPQILIVSHLIGKTTAALREAGLNTEATKFVQEIKNNVDSPDYSTIFKIALKYVQFYD